MADLSKVNVEEKMQVGTPMKTVFAICMFVGLLAFIATYINDSNRAWHAYVIGLFYFPLGLIIGEMRFLAIVLSAPFTVIWHTNIALNLNKMRKTYTMKQNKDTI